MNRQRAPGAAILATAAAVAASLATIFCLGAAARAVLTRSFVLDDAESLAAGNLERTAVHSSGYVTAGAELRRFALEGAALAYSLVRGPDGALYVGTGNEGRVYRVRGDDVSVFAETSQLLVASLAVGGDGTLYAGTLPEGRVYAVSSTGTVRELARLEGAEHVWSLAWDSRRRTLFAATGPEGRVFGVDASGRAEVWYDGDDAHVMSLALDEAGVLYAGTSDDALLLRLPAPGRSEVVYDFAGNEVTAIAVRGGTIAVAANDFPAPPTPAQSATPSPTPSSTPGSTPGSTSGTASTSSSAASRPRSGKGRLWKIGSDGRPEQVLARDEGHFTAVYIARDGVLYAGSGAEGRIYRISPDRTTATWIDVDERQVLALDFGEAGPAFTTGDGAAVYRVLAGRPASAVWTSKVLDAQFASRWGELTWRARGALSMQTRAGNTQEPDSSWSDWSSPMDAPGAIRSAGARFLQVRGRFERDPSAELLALTAYYVPQNQRGVVTSVALKPRDAAGGEGSSADTASGSDPPRPSPTRTLTWKVDNPDGDRLRYRLRFRAEGQGQWRDLTRATDVQTSTEYPWDTSAVPDGYYVVQVEASDELANPDVYALRATAESEPFLVDNHAPTLEPLGVTARRIAGRAVDAVGPISRLDYAVDGGEWSIFFPSDDLLDTRDERFELDLATVAAGSHIVAVRATDAGGNTVTVEMTVRFERAGR